VTRIWLLFRVCMQNGARTSYSHPIDLDFLYVASMSIKEGWKYRGFLYELFYLAPRELLMNEAPLLS
jgi:hypothetical protein